MKSRENNFKQEVKTMHDVMRAKKTTDAFVRDNMIVYHWQQMKEKKVVTEATFKVFDDARKKVDEFSKAVMKDMPWSVFSSEAKAKVKANKDRFFAAVTTFVEENVSNKDIQAYLYYYAAASKASVYSGAGYTAKGKTYDNFVAKVTPASSDEVEMREVPKKSRTCSK